MVAIKGMKEMPKICSECDFCHGHICKRTGIDIITNPKSGCPLVEIVTCKDCKHCCRITDTPNVLLCGKHNCQQVSKNFYCADGERNTR